MARRVEKGAFADLAVAGSVLAVRVTPNARAEAVERQEQGLHIAVTATPEDGRANAAVIRLLARALGVAPTRLTLAAGAAARVKRFRLD